MEENKDVQIHVKKIPAFTVFKNGSILKNIFLLRNPPPSSTRESAVDSSSRTRESNEEILLVGRHPNCNIRLEHPSISRFHLRIHANPSSHTLSVIDLSSVHGTWVSGKRIDPGVHVKLKEGDTVKIGSSSRIYELHWVPLSQAYDIDNPFVPAMYMSKEREEETNQDDENCPHLDKLKPQLSDDDLEGSNLSCSNKIQHFSLNKMNPLTSSAPNDLNSSCDDATVEHFGPLGTCNKNVENFVQLIVPGIEDSNSLNESENQSNWSTGNTSGESEQLNLNSSIMSKAGEEQLNQDDENCPCLDKLETQLSDDDLESSNLSCSNKKFNSNDLNSSCDDASVEHFGPLGTCNKNVENFVQLIVPGIEDSNSLNESENQSNWSTGNTSGESEQLNLNSSIMSKAGEEQLNQLSDDDLESSNLSCSNKKFNSNDLNSSCDDASVEHFGPLGTCNKNVENFVQLIVPGIEDSNSLNESENQSNWSTGNTSGESEQLNLNSSIMSKAGEEQLNQDDENCPCLDKLETQLSDDDLESSNLSCSNKKFNSNDLNSSFGDAAVEHFSPSGTCNKNGENGKITGTISAAEDSDSLNESEDQSNWSRDNMNDEFEQLNHGTLKDDLVSMALSDATNLEKDALKQEITRGNEIDMGDECELLTQQKIENDSVPVALFDGVIRDENGAFTPDGARAKKVDIDGEFEQRNQSKMKIEAASIALFDDNVDQNLNMGVKFESFDTDPTKKEPVSMNQERALIPDISRTKEVHMNLFDGLDENEWDIFTPDKENKNPNSCSVKSMKKKDFSPKVLGFSKTLFTKVDEINDVFTPEKVDLFVNRKKVLCSLENKSKSRSMKMEGSCKSINHPHIKKVIDSSHNFPGGAKKRWTMVVDTNTLLHGESLKHLKILQGLEGTQLFVPKIVMKELLDIKGQHNHSQKRTKNVSLALKWIEECTANTRSWIHVDEETEESEVLETALHLLKTTTDHQVIILSTDLTLKIKAMAEGVMCEEAKEFRRSLVNPFSERFMWVGSVARGLTWSCVDDGVLKQKYYGKCSLNATRGLKGLTATTFQ